MRETKHGTVTCGLRGAILAVFLLFVVSFSSAATITTPTGLQVTCEPKSQYATTVACSPTEAAKCNFVVADPSSSLFCGVNSCLWSDCGVWGTDYNTQEGSTCVKFFGYPNCPTATPSYFYNPSTDRCEKGCPDGYFDDNSNNLRTDAIGLISASRCSPSSGFGWGGYIHGITDFWREVEFFDGYLAIAGNGCYREIDRSGSCASDETYEGVSILGGGLCKKICRKSHGTYTASASCPSGTLDTVYDRCVNKFPLICHAGCSAKIPGVGCSGTTSCTASSGYIEDTSLTYCTLTTNQLPPMQLSSQQTCAGQEVTVLAKKNDGTLLGDASITVKRDGATISSGSTGSGGTFKFTPSAAGTYTIAATHSSSAPASTTVTIPACPQIQLTAEGRCAGEQINVTAKRSDGSGLGGANINTLLNGAAFAQGMAANDGRYVVTPPSPGTYSITASAPAYTNASASVTIVQCEPTVTAGTDNITISYPAMFTEFPTTATVPGAAVISTGVSSLSIVPNKNLAAKTLTVTKSMTRPAGTSELPGQKKVLQYLTVTTNIQDADISAATLSFAVPKSAIDGKNLDINRVKLMKTSGLFWNDIPTTKLAQETSDDYYFSAQLSGFSEFAVVSEEKIYITPVGSGGSCTYDAQCPFGEICGGNDKCEPCPTSAACVKKTFEKAAPFIGAISPWATISIMVVLIALLASGLVYVIGYSFDIQQIKQIGKAELAQAIASLILIAMLFGAEQFEFSLLDLAEKQTGAITAAIYSPTQFEAGQSSALISVNPFDVSYAFVRNMIKCAQTKYEDTYTASVPFQFLANFNIQIRTKFWILNDIGTPANPLMFAGVGTKVAESEYLADELTWLLIFLYAQLSFLKFIETSMFTVFLPIGLILRSFPPTRGAGAVMTAIAIGLYIVYPLVFTILYIGTPPAFDGCSVLVSSETVQIQNTCPIAVGGAAEQISNVQSAAATVDLNMPQIQATSTNLRYVAFIYMLISIGATLMFVRSASGMLGADISEIGRTMFRMI